jgi:magnesium transporter
MLVLHSCSAEPGKPATDLTAGSLPPETVWVDLMKAEAEEIRYVERATGLQLPTYESLSEIESSSRLRSEGGTLYLSTPVVFRAQSGLPRATPVGFVLTPDILITVRFEQLTAFTTFAERAARPQGVHTSSIGAFVGLTEAMVDRMADVLEKVGADLDEVSHRVFRADVEKPGRRRATKEGGDLREALRRVGRCGDLASKIRDSLLGIGRIVPYVTSIAADWLPAEVKPHLRTLHQDIVSLTDYDQHLTNKLQMLLDATLGLINTEQYNIIKVLTVVSVVGVPPTLVASVYGMNFHDMPELSWSYGYPFGLALIVLSAIGPLVWFKLRGWL